MRHFLSLADLTPQSFRDLLDEAHRRKAARAGLPKGAPDADAPLAGRTLAMIFEKSSTRTRFSFEQAMRQLGGSAIVATADQMQLGRGEPVADTARVLGRYVDAIMARVNSHATLEGLAEHAGVPVINGLSDLCHPCQIVADLQTLEERGHDLATAKIAWLGDGNNVCASYINAAALAGYELHLSCPPEYPANAELVAAARARGATIVDAPSPEAAADGAHAVVTDCWVSMGDTDADARLQALAPYRVDAPLMARAEPSATFLHCLPAYRGKEVTEDVLEGEQSAVWDAAENRLHAQKAVLGWCVTSALWN